MIALDTETRLMAPGRRAPDLVCVSVSTGELYHRSDDWRGLVAQALARGVVGHNVAYDAGVILAGAPELMPCVFDAYENDRVTDTMLREQLADIATGAFRGRSRKGGIGYSLAACAKNALGVDLEKGTVRVRYGELYDTPVAQWPAAFRDYAVTDAKTTYDLYQSQTPHADEHRQARAALWLHLTSTWGMVVDHDAVARLEKAVAGQLALLADRLVARGLARHERGKIVRNMRAVQEAVAGAYTAQGRDYPRTDGGLPSCDRGACQGSGDPDLDTYAEYSALGSVLSKELPALRSSQPVHTRFGLAESGRTTSREPNVQNLPRKACPCNQTPCLPWCCGYHVRECFVPRPGRVFVVADYAGAELATLAQACVTLLGRSTLGEYLNRGIDPHLVVASQILRQPYEWCLAHKKDHVVYNARQTGKVANFGLPGGLGAQTLVYYAKQSYGVTLTLDEAEALKRTWLSLYPEMRDYFALIGRTTERFGYVDQLFSSRRRGDVGFCDACNTLFQGLAADMAKDAGWRIMRECYDWRLRSPLFGSRIVNFVHDEFVIETADPTVGRRVETLMIEAAQRWCPDVRLGVEWAAMTRYSKSSKYEIVSD